MAKDFTRPQDKEALEDGEAAGFWKAIALSKDLGESVKKIDLNLVLELHGKMFASVQPEIAGRFRVEGEDVKKLTCIEPPLGKTIRGIMLEFEKDLAFRFNRIPQRPDRSSGKRYREWIDSVFDFAAWTQHKLVAIHPFCEGNGRVARLMTNVILRRFKIPPTDVKIEGEDKAKYLNALCQIDNHLDYEPLKSLLLKGSTATLKMEREKRENKRAAA